jgi:RNA polymerase sigma factor (sigma-70 family)
MVRQGTGSDGSSLATEAVLFGQAQAGCHDSLNALMERHRGLVYAAVGQQVLGDLPYAEALHAGQVGLWRAILGYDPHRGYAFSTYAWPSIVHHIWQAVKAHTRSVQHDCALLAHERLVRIPCSGADPFALYQDHAIRQALSGLVQRLPDRLRTVMVARYGLDGSPPRWFHQIGVQLGVTGERVRQLHTQALVWLRHPAHSQHLRSLLGCHTQADYQWADGEAQRWLRQRGGRHAHP